MVVMRNMLILFVFIGLVGVAGCGGASVGAVCSDDSQCAEGLECPTGTIRWCTMDCTTDSDCPEGSVCHLGSLGWCLKSCTSDFQCTHPEQTCKDNEWANTPYCG